LKDPTWHFPFRATELEEVLGPNDNMVRNLQRKQPKACDSDATATAEDILSAEEERSLAAAIARGDMIARERMITMHQRLAYKIARQWKGHGVDRADLISEAMCGLIRAVDQFDPNRGVRFCTCAAHWIKQSLSRTVETSANLIVLPSNMWKLIRRWKGAARTLSATLGHSPTPEEIADSLGFTRAQARSVTTAMAVGVKLASTIVGEGSMLEVLEICSNQRVTWDEPEEPDEPPERKILRALLNRLSPIERIVLAHRYGLYGKRPRTLSELSRIIGKTRQAVRSIQFRAEKKLRAAPISRCRRKRPPAT
jgi:RNA polymerase sigma factor (sigma-70 family)